MSRQWVVTLSVRAWTGLPDNFRTNPSERHSNSSEKARFFNAARIVLDLYRLVWLPRRHKIRTNHPKTVWERTPFYTRTYSKHRIFIRGKKPQELAHIARITTRQWAQHERDRSAHPHSAQPAAAKRREGSMRASAARQTATVNGGRP